MKAAGDSHRFGKFVGFQKDESGNWYVKPRSVSLERLLLDQDATPRMMASVLNYSPPGKVISHSPWLGCSKEILAHTNLSQINVSDKYAERCGNLLALATFLGMADLHNENILISEIGGAPTPVPIDVEIAFWDCISGMDTLLFPSKIIGPEKAGFTAQLSTPYVPHNISPLLDGFLQSTKTLIPHLPSLLRDLENETTDHPIRVILRPTRVYRNMLKELSSGRLPHPEDMPLLKEEVLQLEAGDIPYFCTFRSSNPKLHYYSSSSTISECDPTHFSNIFAAASRPISFLIQEERLNRLRKVTALHICRSYSSSYLYKQQPLSVPSNHPNYIKGTHFTLSWEESTFTLNTPWFHASASANRKKT